MCFDGSTEILANNPRKRLGIRTTIARLGTQLSTGIRATILLLLLSPVAVSGQEYDLRLSSEVGRTQRVRVIVEVQGNLKLNPDGKKIQQVPLQLAAEMLYDEKNLAIPTGLRKRTARYYHQAEADIRLGSTRLYPKLEKSNRTILVQIEKSRATLFPPSNALTREQLDLIDAQGNSALLGSLLPNKPVKIGESWQPGKVDLSLLLGLDIVNETNIQCTLKSVQKQAALIEIKGTLDGAVGGVASKMDVEAKMNVDLANRRVAWLTMAIEEERAIGHAEPGFEVVARVRLSTLPLEDSPQLADKVLTGLPRQIDPAAAALQFASEAGGFRMLHDRRWRVMVDRREVTILRLVDRGDLIAQCNISRLSDLAAGKQVTIESFQKEIQAALDKNFGQFVEATESTTGNDLKVLKVVATGTASDLPIRWTYYHVINREGHRASCVYTLEEKLVERFAKADELVIRSFEILRSENPDAGKAPTPAKTTRANGQKQSK